MEVLVFLEVLGLVFLFLDFKVFFNKKKSSSCVCDNVQQTPFIAKFGFQVIRLFVHMGWF